MMKRKGKDHYILSNGKEIYAHQGIIGIKPDYDLEELRLAHGYDGSISVKSECIDEYYDVTMSESLEIASHMVLLWMEVLDGIKLKMKNESNI